MSGPGYGGVLLPAGNPGGGLPAGALNSVLVFNSTSGLWQSLQHDSVYVQQDDDITNNTTAFADMGDMTATVTVPTVVGIQCGLRAHFQASVSTSGGNVVTLVKFRLLLDGVFQPLTICGASPPVGDNGSESASIVWQSAALTAGAHTVKIQWKNFNAATSIAHCRPVAAIESESAALLVESRLIG